MSHRMKVITRLFGRKIRQDAPPQVSVNPQNAAPQVARNWLEERLQYQAMVETNEYALRYRAMVKANEHLHQQTGADYTRDEKIAMTRQATNVDYNRDRLRAQAIDSKNRHPLVVRRAALEFKKSVVVQRSIDAPRKRPPVRKHKRSSSTAFKARLALASVDTCAYCGKTPKGHDQRSTWHIDHVVPVSKGGADDLSNMVKACRACNMKKSADLWVPLLGTPYADGHRQEECTA